MTRPPRVRVAIIGAGLMGRWHARAAEHAGATITAVVDADPDRAKQLARAHGARAASSLRDAASLGTLDVVHVCTPLETHATLTREAIALGLHVLVEKPLAPNAGETESLLRDATAKGVVICPVHQFPFQHGVRAVLAALPRIGPVLHATSVACSAGATDTALRDRVAEDILPHPLSLFATLLDAPIASAGWNVRRPEPGELLATGQAGSVTLTAHVSMSGRPTTNTLTVIGARGTAHADLFHGFAVLEGPEVSRANKILHPFALAAATIASGSVNLVRRSVAGDSAYPGLRELVAAFHASARDGAAPPISAERIMDVARARDVLIDAAHRQV